MSSKIDKNLIDKAVKGDAAAFSQIYFGLRGAIYSFSYRMLGNFATAEDVMQEVFLFFIENPQKYNAELGELFPFLCGVARNRIFNRLKKQQAQNEIFREDLETFDEPEDQIIHNPLKLLLDEELIEKVEEGIAGLSVLQREVLILREIEGLSYEEIAQITETQLSSVKVRLHRARRNLAKELEPYLSPCEEKNYEVY